MTEWAFEIHFALDDETKTTLDRKHYIKHAPFGKVTIHEMYLEEFVKDFKENNKVFIEIDPKHKKIACKPSKE